MLILLLKKAFILSLVTFWDKSETPAKDWSCDIVLAGHTNTLYSEKPVLIYLNSGTANFITTIINQ
jgi:hypothetical protein